MHDGGERMMLYINDKLVCTSNAIYKKDTRDAGTIDGMSRCGEVIPVKKGDILTIESLYDLKRHIGRMDVHGEEAHGMMAGMDYMGMWAITLTAAAKGSVAS
jgi:hypothetical protein